MHSAGRGRLCWAVLRCARCAWLPPLAGWLPLHWRHCAGQATPAGWLPCAGSTALLCAAPRRLPSQAATCRLVCIPARPRTLGRCARLQAPSLLRGALRRGSPARLCRFSPCERTLVAMLCAVVALVGCAAACTSAPFAAYCTPTHHTHPPPSPTPPTHFCSDLSRNSLTGWWHSPPASPACQYTLPPAHKRAPFNSNALAGAPHR